MYEWQKQIQVMVDEIDRYFLGFGEIGMMKSTEGINTYFVTIPAHKFLHVENKESNGYWDFWEKPPQMQLIDVPEAEYLVFEHGPFDYEQENRSVEDKIEAAMASFDFTDTGYCFDTSPG